MEQVKCLACACHTAEFTVHMPPPFFATKWTLYFAFKKFIELIGVTLVNINI